MHDPLVVAFEIRRPWPKRTPRRRYYYWPSLITIWHAEPGGRDAFEVCKRSSHWRWHLHHWKIQIRPLQNLRRRLLTSCAECGRKGSPNISHQWDRERSPWWRGERGLYHRECSSLIHLRRRKEQDEALIRALAAECRVRSDETHDQLLERLTGHHNTALDFHLRYRLKGILAPDDQDVTS